MGLSADIIKCSGECPILECETEANADSPILYRTPKFAASAARLYGGKEVSCEIFTYLRRPGFLVSPRMMKVAPERAYCHGVNPLIYHGYSYSPRFVGTPAWYSCVHNGESQQHVVAPHQGAEQVAIHDRFEASQGKIHRRLHRLHLSRGHAVQKKPGL